MDVKSFILQQVAAAHRLSDTAISGVTQEQFNWVPEGPLNPIKSAYLHAVASEDSFIQKIIMGKASLWDSGNWSAQIGLEMPPGPRGGWEEARAATLAVSPVLAYAEAVCEATNTYLATLTEDELDRSISLWGRESTVAVTLALLVTHLAGHAGEIAAVKGMQGVKGLPF